MSTPFRILTWRDAPVSKNSARTRNEPRRVNPPKDPTKPPKLEREPKRTWPDRPTYKQWLGRREDTPLEREGFRAFSREFFSPMQEEEFFKLMDATHQALRERAEADKKYSAALRALAAFGPVPPRFESQIAERVRLAIRPGVKDPTNQ